LFDLRCLDPNEGHQLAVWGDVGVLVGAHARERGLGELPAAGLALPGPERWSVLGFDPGGNRLAALYDNGTALVWDVNPENWRKRACAVVGRPLTREEWEELLPRRSYQPACQ
jgi:hypothetical protein